MSTPIAQSPLNIGKKDNWRTIIAKDFVRNKYIYIMAIPVLAYYIIFQYGPMYGLMIAFKDFSPGKGIWGSPWVGFKHFESFFNGPYAWQLIRNTLLISIYSLLWGFPAPIILALLLNEVRNNTFKRTVQTITYLPHFISLVVVCGLIVDFTASDGVINDIIEMLGGQRTNFMMKPEWFRTIYIGSGIWQEIGWGSIIYLAAITNIDPQLYEAATIDGASRWRQTFHITIPGITPTIVILLILRLGGLMSVGHEKILLLYNPTTMETADVISTYVYRRGLLDFDYSFSTAVGLFNSLINFGLLVAANAISRKVSETSLW
ncbi:ABC transporter permease [Mahella australiensis]|uniref:Carbohydrate ABC transporter membrane protein 1, CUT1 family n=1 Tax=Mahella australiensis (strain DSM 15567 / CIP 107919 / 50-1 BON) TaxID=697281 RepID=F3ZZN8_MAHA5|nr:ABC transporter permease subunit [Mahella australiensis]AEE96864.1 carbohydrate ABC transporter membrane protein 1, CUT1 family [Mahella australiensis 50-1 BON]